MHIKMPQYNAIYWGNAQLSSLSYCRMRYTVMPVRQPAAITAVWVIAKCLQNRFFSRSFCIFFLYSSAVFCSTSFTACSTAVSTAVSIMASNSASSSFQLTGSSLAQFSNFSSGFFFCFV